MHGFTPLFPCKQEAPLKILISCLAQRGGGIEFTVILDAYRSQRYNGKGLQYYERVIITIAPLFPY